MKHLIILLASSALLAGCVAVPYDTNPVYYPAPAVSATISSGHYHTYPDSYPYYRPSPYYQRPTYVTPAPVIVQPPVHSNHNRTLRPGIGIMHQHHSRHDGAQDDQHRGNGRHRHDDARPDQQKRDDGKHGDNNEWRRKGQSRHADDRFHSK